MRLDIIENICNTIIQNKKNLTDLDHLIGDGDHGINISSGMEKILEEIPTFEKEKLNDYEILNKCAMFLMSNASGVSASLYASGLLKGASFLKAQSQEENQNTKELIAKTWEQIILGIQKRGRTKLGEKTMLDTLHPAYEAFLSEIKKDSDLKTAFKKATTAGKVGMESTRHGIATKGRAALLGKKSKGHIDAGAMSSYLILKAISEKI